MNKLKTIITAVLLFSSFASQAALIKYETTLNLQNPVVDGIDSVVFDWSTEKTSGVVGGGDLVDYSMSLFAGAALIYNDDILVNGVKQLFGGLVRANPFWVFNLGSMQLEQFNQGTDAILTLAAGTNYMAIDGLSLPLDGIVRVRKFDGSLTSSQTLLLSQSTIAVPEPSIVALFAAGLLGFGVVRRRKRV